ncbi:hypothetical protein APED_22165 [Acanthopleuribacter pedis]
MCVIASNARGVTHVASPSFGFVAILGRARAANHGDVTVQNTRDKRGLLPQHGLTSCYNSPPYRPRFDAVHVRGVFWCHKNFEKQDSGLTIWPPI